MTALWWFSPAAIAGILMPTKVTIRELDMKALEDTLRRVDANELTEEDCATIRALFESYVQLTGLLKDKNTNIARLRKILFGGQTEKTSAVIGSEPASALPPSRAADAGKTAETQRKGHGRHRADA